MKFRFNIAYKCVYIDGVKGQISFIATANKIFKKRNAWTKRNFGGMAYFPLLT